MKLKSIAIKRLLGILVVCPGGVVYSFISGHLDKVIIISVITAIICLMLFKYWKFIFKNKQLFNRLLTYTLLLIGAFWLAAITPEYNNAFAGVAFFILTPILIIAAISISKSKEIDSFAHEK